MSLFSIVYYLVLSIAYILALPFLFLKINQKKYKDAIPAKFFLRNNPKFDKSGIWFHSCSLGETVAIKSLLQEYKSKANITVITNTGFQEAKKTIKNVRYLPFEIFLPFWVSSQKVLVVMEAELWYMLFLCAKKKGAKTFLINARISDKSYNSYKRFSFLYKKIFQNIDKVFAQSQVDKERLEILGAKNVEIIGNIKLANLPKAFLNLEKPKEVLITAASTHKKEEELILQAYKKEYGKLIVVPRHPERFDEVDELIKEYIKFKNFSYHRYSSKKDFKSDIVLVDKMGLLNEIYSISDVVILGGAFEKIGGHNPIEPATFSCRIISGENIFNQKSLFECIENYYIIKNDEIEKYLKDIKNLKRAKLKKIGSFDSIKKEIEKWL